MINLIHTSKVFCGQRCTGLGSDGLADPPVHWPAELLAGGAVIAAEFLVAAAAAAASV